MTKAAPNSSLRDFFISYTNVDKAWAVWIAVELEKAGYTTVVQAFDFRPGSDFVHEMQAAVQNTRRTIAVLSPEYFASEFSEAEWRTTFAADPTGTALKLIPVKVRAVQPLGMLRTRVYIDLCDSPEHAARIELINGVDENLRRPEAAPFPGRPASPGSPVVGAPVPGASSDPGFPIPYPGREESPPASKPFPDSALLIPVDRLNQRLIISPDAAELAKAYSEAGQYRVAVQLLDDIATATQQLRGAEHPDTFAARNGLGRAYFDAGRTRDAIALHERNLADRERVLGPDHPDTLTSRNNLAIAYQAAGRTRDAIALHERNLADLERVLGVDRR